MRPDPNENPAPRETAAGLQRGDEPPKQQGGSPARSKANPASQANMIDDRSSPDEFDVRKKSQTGKQVTADKWNQ